VVGERKFSLEAHVRCRFQRKFQCTFSVGFKLILARKINVNGAMWNHWPSMIMERE